MMIKNQGAGGSGGAARSGAVFSERVGMFAYYSILIFLSVLALLSVQICVANSPSLDRRQKHHFHVLYLTIMTAALCEWAGAALQGAGPHTRLLHIAVKTVELSLAPSISVWIAWTIEKRRAKLVYAALALNAALELLSGVFGFIFLVDGESYYFHARFYWIYMAAYVVSMLYYVYIVLRNVRRYQYNGMGYFLSTVLFTLAGIVIQLWDSRIKTVYFTLTLSTIMLYVFSLEMLYQVDALTQLISRRGYDNYISRLERPCVIAFFDVDRFKEVNDVYGHAFGDETLRIIGRTIREQYARYGKCFRYGGDEFCAVLPGDDPQIEQIDRAFLQELARQREQEPRLPYVSIGYARYDPGTDRIEDAAEKADQMMYRYKAAHRESGVNAPGAACSGGADASSGADGT